MPLRDGVPETLALDLHVAQQRFLVDARRPAAFHECLAVDDDGLDVTAGAALDQRLDRIVHGAVVELAQIDHDDIGLRARRQPAEVVAPEVARAAERGGVEDVLRSAHPEASVGHAAHQGGPAHLVDEVLRVRVGAERDVDPERAIALERLELHAHLGVLVGRVNDRHAAVGEELQVVRVRVVAPGVLVVKDAVPEARVGLQEADRVQELDRRLAVLLENVVELALVHRSVELHRHAQIVGPAARPAQEIRRAGVELAGIQHRLDASVVGAVVLLDVCNRSLEPGHPGGLIPFPDDPAAIEGIARGAKRRPHVCAYAELAGDACERGRTARHRADVHDRRGAGAERRPQAVGSRHVRPVARSRQGRAPARRDVADEVAPEVVGLEPVEEDRLPRVRGRVQVTIDQAGSDQLAGGIHTPVDRSVEAGSDVNDAVVLEDHAPVRNQLVSATVVADHPSALDQRSHRRHSW